MKWTPEIAKVMAAGWEIIKLHPDYPERGLVYEMLRALGIDAANDMLDIWGLSLRFRGYTAPELIVTISNNKLKVVTVSGRGPEEEIEWYADGGPTAAEIASNIEAAWKVRRLRAETAP